jgi:hypothetical protein
MFAAYFFNNLGETSLLNFLVKIHVTAVIKAKSTLISLGITV